MYWNEREKDLCEKENKNMNKMKRKKGRQNTYIDIPMSCKVCLCTTHENNNNIRLYI